MSGDHQVVLNRPDLDALFDVLLAQGYQIIGPTVRDDAIVLAELDDASRLPWGWGVELGPGSYRLRERPDGAAFANSCGPQSWKRFLHPPRELMWSADRADGYAPKEPERPIVKYAFVGVRPCDLRAIQILDRVLSGGDHTDEGYRSRRMDVFVVTAECTVPGETCFCASMGTGPAADSGYDLALVELPGADHRFVVRAGSDRGTAVLAELPARPAPQDDVEEARGAVADAARHMGRLMPEADLRQLLVDSRESPRWDDVASRCLTCGNCTLVCPTCFCTTTEEVTDLTGDHTERWQRWDSCFDLTFSYLHGGSVRESSKSRYRQWMSHKLSTWYDQFGSSGCVGCGRCIAWCPVGIDITEEAAALHAEQNAEESSR
ncbi:4Fe-4S dicluster domain-containing protein [Flindersiella endophytica]